MCCDSKAWSIDSSLKARRTSIRGEAHAPRKKLRIVEAHTAYTVNIRSKSVNSEKIYNEAIKLKPRHNLEAAFNRAATPDLIVYFVEGLKLCLTICSDQIYNSTL